MWCSCPALRLTCASVSPSIAASCFLSGLVTYFWISNLFSSPFLCRLENTALDHDLFLLYVCGIVSLVRTAYGPERHEGDARLERKREQKPERGLTAGVTEPDWASFLSVTHSPTCGVYLGRCPETDAGLFACCCCCCLVNSSWRTRRSSRGLWRRSTGWPEAERGGGCLTDGSS